jgi:hypothetical protein
VPILSRKVRRLFSARNLNDVPPSVRIGSPYDADEGEVYQMAQHGLLHPGTNYGVVYRVAFKNRMGPGEEPISVAPGGLPIEGMPSTLVMRFGWVIPPERVSESGSFQISQKEIEQGLFGAWVLLTNQGIRWHYTGDGVPGVFPGLDEGLGRGIRSITYPQVQGQSSHHVGNLAASGKTIDVDFFVFAIPAGAHGFGFSGSYQPENLRWYEFVRKQD